MDHFKAVSMDRRFEGHRQRCNGHWCNCDWKVRGQKFESRIREREFSNEKSLNQWTRIEQLKLFLPVPTDGDIAKVHRQAVGGFEWPHNVHRVTITRMLCPWRLVVVTVNHFIGHDVAVSNDRRPEIFWNVSRAPTTTRALDQYLSLC